MKINAIIQARMTSTRLPGKVLMSIHDKPLLWYVVNRLNKSKYLDKIIIATSTDYTDDPIVEFCQSEKFQFFRGDLVNVLKRYYDCARVFKSDTIVRITGDCPLIDINLVDQGIKIFKAKKIDYLTNIVKRTYPRGFDFEVISMNCLTQAYNRSTEFAEKEHVTPYIWKTHSDQFNIYHLKQKNDKSFYRLTVDTKQDLELINILIEKYHAHKLNPEQITEILDNHPELVEINHDVKQKEYGH